LKPSFTGEGGCVGDNMQGLSWDCLEISRVGICPNLPKTHHLPSGFERFVCGKQNLPQICHLRAAAGTCFPTLD